MKIHDPLARAAARPVDSLSLAEAQTWRVQGRPVQQARYSSPALHPRHRPERSAAGHARAGGGFPDDTAAADEGARDARQRSRQSGDGCMGRAAWAERRLEEEHAR
eukprot:scaffold49815_cov40-Phaeocystis_antarctica.AAC.1